MEQSITIHYGTLAKPLKIQLKAYEIELDDEIVKHFQKDIDALNRLRIRDILTTSCVNSANKKLHNKIMKEINNQH